MSHDHRPGDANRITREYIDSLLIEMRHIDAVLPSTEYSLFGNTFATPVMTAALSHLNNLHPDGMVELARGAVAAKAVMWAGMGDMEELNGIVKTGAKTIKIIKPYEDDEDIYRRIAHAERVGCIAVGIDVDHAFGHDGEYDVVHNLPMRPKTSACLAEFVKSTKLPFIIKGVLSIADAEKCMKIGVKGIVVSHHHGILNYAVPPLMILPEIAKAVDGQMEIFVDCGIESGTDVFKSIALGACAASLGRALMPPLSENGAEGVKAAIEACTRELKHAMALTNANTLKKITTDLIRQR